MANGSVFHSLPTSDYIMSYVLLNNPEITIIICLSLNDAEIGRDFKLDFCSCMVIVLFPCWM